MTTSAVRVTDAVKTYGEGTASVTALAGVTAAFADGQFTATRASQVVTGSSQCVPTQR